MLDASRRLRQFVQPQLLLGGRTRTDGDGPLATEYHKRVVLGILGEQRPHRHVAKHLEGLRDRRLERVQQNVRKEEEHPLLEATLGMFKEATLPDELPVGLNERVESDQVALDLAQQGVILRGGQFLPDDLRRSEEHHQRAVAIRPVEVVLAVMLEQQFQQQLIVQQTVQGFHDEVADRQVAHLLLLKVPIGLLEALVVLVQVVQPLQDLPVALDVLVVDL